jgi:membrane associated rhomboid family serine protease
MPVPFPEPNQRLLQRLEELPIVSEGERRSNVVIGWAIAASWVAASVAALVAGKGLPLEQQPALVHYALGRHPFSEGPLLVHLLTYSFIHAVGLHLVFSLLAWWTVLNLAIDRVSPAVLVRLYSLGSIATGLIYLLVSARVGNQSPLIGAGGSIMAFMGALAVLHPSLRVYFLFVKEITLPWVAVWLFLWQVPLLRSAPSLALGMMSGLVAGVLYGAGERLAAKWADR